MRPANSDDEVLSDAEAIAELKRILLDPYAWEAQKRKEASFSLEELLLNESTLAGDME